MRALDPRCLFMSRACSDLPVGQEPPVDKAEFDILNRWSPTGSLFGPHGFLLVCFK